MTLPSRTALDHDLHLIQADLLRMSDLLDTAIRRAMRALTDQDTELAREVIADDQFINALRFQIEETCLTLIATQQPAAGDLRTIVAAQNIVGDLERMADHAASIAKTVLRINTEPHPMLWVDLPHMANLCREMLHRALDAYALRDAALAREVAGQDELIDRLYRQFFRELVSVMIKDPHTTTPALYLLFAAHNLERIGDRVINIAERVIFMTSGEMKELNTGPDGRLE